MKRKNKQTMKNKNKRNKQKTAETYNSPMLTSEVEMLSGNCSEWSTGRAYIPCSTVTISNNATQECKQWVSINMVVAGLTLKKNYRLKIDKYTYFRDELRTQSKIYHGSFLQK